MALFICTRLESGENPEESTTRPEYLESLDALRFASKLYKTQPDALVELSITKTTLNSYQWYGRSLNHARAFACIATFETGYLNVDPSTIEDVIGVSAGSSLYIAQFLWLDPYLPRSLLIRRSIGNVGKRGMAFLISPKDPNVKEPGFDRWKLVQHAPFDGAMEDNFPETSLHLSFTGNEQALNTGEHGLRDKEVYFLQSVVQVYERGNWIADLDILNASMGADSQELIERLPTQCSHSDLQAANFEKAVGEIVSIDCWDELLDDPEKISIARAKGNWLARLALTVVAFQKKKQVVIAGERVCWACVRESRIYSTNGGVSKDAIIVC